MNAFIGLLKKDLTLMRFWYIIWLIFTALCMGGGYALTIKVGEPSGVVPLYIMVAGVHIFLMPMIMLRVLRIEGKTQMWLYSPQSSQKLLLSKISAAFLLQLFSQIILLMYGYFVMNILQKNALIERFSEFLPVKQGVFFQLGLLAGAVYISVWVVFLWTVYHSLSGFPKLRNFRWLVVVLIWAFYNILEAFLVRIHVIQNELFTFGFNYQMAPRMHYEVGGWRLQFVDLSLPIIPIIFYTILSIVLFWASCRLLDQKVEV